MTDPNQQLVEGQAETKVPPLPLVDQVADLREVVDQQHRHILALHRYIDQLADELNRQTGAAWRPSLAGGDSPTALVTADRTPRARRTDRYRVAAEDRQRESEASES